MDQPGKVANPARGQLNRENNIPLSPCVPENLVSRDGFSRPVPRQPAHLHTQAESGAYLRDSSRVPRRRPYETAIRHRVSPEFIGSRNCVPMAFSCCCCFVVVVVSHIQRIGCQPEKTTLHGGQSRSWSAEQGKENKRKSLAAYPPPPTPHTARSEKINKITRRIYRRYAGGRSRVRTRIPSAHRLGLWVWLRKILHSRLR